MARARSSGPMSFIWAVVVLGFAFVICLILAILFYTRIEAAEKKAADASAALNQFASSAEQTNPEVRRLMGSDAAAGGPGTVVAKLLDDNTRLKQIISGEPNIGVPEIINRMNDQDVSEGNLLQAIKRLRDNLESEKQLNQQLDTNYKEAMRRQQDAETARARLGEEYNTSVEALKSELTTIRASFREFQRRVEEQAGQFTTQLSEVRAQGQRSVGELESQLAQRDQIIERQRQRIDQLTGELKGPGTVGDVDPSTLPDGKVASVEGGQNQIYIDRGAADRIIRGITFEVYDRKTGVVKNHLGEYRGKATIEVINVLPNASVARIVRLDRGQEILEGDVIANLIYDPDAVFKFFVYGEFDIDRTGNATETDRRRIESMIEAWGGQVASSRAAGGAPQQITYDVDFLVLGEEPPLPQEPDKDVVDPVAYDAYQRAKARFENYHGLVTEARELSIPILNQNRFLTMIGYYRR